MTCLSPCQRAPRYAITWQVRVRRVHDSTWDLAKGVNLSVTGALLRLNRSYRIGECLEFEIDCFVRPEIKTMLRGVGEVVRSDGTGQHRAAIHFDIDGVHFDMNGTSIVH
jgi:hypothetical protein